MSKHSRANEQKFFAALRDIFVGARIEGESGYINLMRIKSRYYTEGVFPKLQEKIDEELQPFPAFREEMFDKLYSFFKRYFSDSGSIYFRHTPYYQDIYERIYTDDRDVMLFWKTQNLYYVKTDRLFRSMTLNLDGAPDQKFAFDATAVKRQSFNFDASGLQNKRNNEKRNLIFEYKGKGEDETLKFAAQYTEGGKKTKTEDILKAIKKDGVAVNEDQLTRAFRLFERQSEVDFFINKNAKAFLDEQFDLWMYQYLFKRESDWTDKRIREMQALKRVARSIIEFISQFEDELVRIWNKPKFALSSNYVITFDRVFARSEELARKLLAPENIKAQIAEWRELGMIDEQFTLESIFRKDEEAAPKTKKRRVKQAETLSFETDAGALASEAIEDADSLPELSAKYRYLPFDTKHFKSLELELLSLFDNLDEELDGRLIHSENYQALNTLKDKFRERVKCIYIDPPYNTGSDEFIYKDEYRHSSWLSMMENRLSLARLTMNEEGFIFASIDDREQSQLKTLFDLLMNEDNLIAQIIVQSNKRGQTYKEIAKTHEYLLCYAKDENAELYELEKDVDNGLTFNDSIGSFDIRELRNRNPKFGRFNRPNLFFPIYVSEKYLTNEGFALVSLTKSKDFKIEVEPFNSEGKESCWRWGKQLVEKQNTSDLQTTNLIAKQTREGKWNIYEKYRKTTYKVKSIWDETEVISEQGTKELADIGLSQTFNHPKPVALIKKCSQISTTENDFIIDFFAGSGTTAHAVINLNREDGGRRKYILVEANDYFHAVILPRVKKIVFSDKWKDGKVQADGKGASHFCKYFALEQYEDTLRRAVYLNDSETEQPAFFDNPYESPFASYVFLRDKKMADALTVDYANNKISVDFSKLYEDIDLAETLSCVKGKFIKSLTAESVTFADGETVKFDELDYRDVLPLIWWDK
ncbi:MAG: site-specific DNA-methyltransferase [Pyrinomonadaceae bacterium]